MTDDRTPGTPPGTPPGPDEKVCPYCAETIKRAAVKCRWCQSELPPADDPTPGPPVAPTVQPVVDDQAAEQRRHDHELAEADASRPAYDGHPDRDPDGVSWPLWVLTALLAFVVVVATVVLVRQVVTRDDATAVPDGTTPLAPGAVTESEEAKRAATQAATSATEQILSYAADTLDDDIAASEELLAGDMVDQYAQTMDTLRDKTVEDEVSVEATVVAVSTVAATEHDARLLLFVNQATTGQHLDQPRADLNRVVVTLHRGDGDWKVTQLDAL